MGDETMKEREIGGYGHCIYHCIYAPSLRSLHVCIIAFMFCICLGHVLPRSCTAQHLPRSCTAQEAGAALRLCRSHSASTPCVRARLCRSHTAWWANGVFPHGFLFPGASNPKDAPESKRSSLSFPRCSSTHPILHRVLGRFPPGVFSRLSSRLRLVRVTKRLRLFRVAPSVERLLRLFRVQGLNPNLEEAPSVRYVR